MIEKPPSLKYRSEYMSARKALLRKRRAKAALIEGKCPHCFKPGQAKALYCSRCFLVPELAPFEDAFALASLRFTAASGKPLLLYKED